MLIHNAEHIGIAIIDESYKMISHYDGNFYDIYDHLFESFNDDLSYPFLNSIDMYGNAFFNDRQTPKLILELNELANQDKDIEVKRDVEKITDYLSNVKDLTYAHFIGD